MARVRIRGGTGQIRDRVSLELEPRVRVKLGLWLQVDSWEPTAKNSSSHVKALVRGCPLRRWPTSAAHFGSEMKGRFCSNGLCQHWSRRNVQNIIMQDVITFTDMSMKCVGPRPHKHRCQPSRIRRDSPAFSSDVPRSREISRCPAFFENGIIIFFVADYSTCLPRNATK